MTEEGPIAREKTELSFRTIDAEETPDRMQRWIKKNQSDEAKKVFHVDGKTYVLIMLGQKSTGGYAVDIEAMELSKVVSPESKEGQGTVNVTYNVTEPEKGSMNIQVLTYPMAIAELEGTRDYGFQFLPQTTGNELKENNEDEQTELIKPEEVDE